MAGTVSFSAYENTDYNPRTGDLTLTYTSSFGTASENVIVAQSGAGSSSGLILSPSVVSAGYKGGSCSFKYAATGYSGGTPDCSADSDWITDIDCSVNGTVSFSVSENDGEAIREGLITVTFDNGETGLTGTVTVVQDHAGGFSVTDVSNLVGTYLATGPALDWGFEQAEWTMKIFEATDDEEFDLYIDGLTPYMSGLYDEYGDNRYSARAYFWHGAIVVPTHVLSSMLPDYAYYVGYTTCLAFEDNQIYYSADWPSVTFTYDADSLSWTSDYGTIVIGVTSSIFQYFPFYFDVTLPTVSMTRISSSTEAAVTSSAQARLLESRESPVGRPILKLDTAAR